MKRSLLGRDLSTGCFLLMIAILGVALRTESDHAFAQESAPNDAEIQPFDDEDGDDGRFSSCRELGEKRDSDEKPTEATPNDPASLPRRSLPTANPRWN